MQLRVCERLTYPALAYALPGMTIGEIRMVRVSPNLTYRERKQNPGLPAGTALRYEIELIALSDDWNNSVCQPKQETTRD